MPFLLPDFPPHPGSCRPTGQTDRYTFLSARMAPHFSRAVRFRSQSPEPGVHRQNPSVPEATGTIPFYFGNTARAVKYGYSGFPRFCTAPPASFPYRSDESGSECQSSRSGSSPPESVSYSAAPFPSVPDFPSSCAQVRSAFSMISEYPHSYRESSYFRSHSGKIRDISAIKFSAASENPHPNTSDNRIR